MSAAANCPTDEQLARWLLATLDLYGVAAATQHRITGLFLAALAEWDNAK